MTTVYVPILRWKRGERIGLQHLNQSAKSRALPIFMLGTEQYQAKAATKSKPAISPAIRFVQEVTQSWGTTSFAVDASSLPVIGGNHPLNAIAATARIGGLTLIPATSLSASSAYQTAVRNCARTDNRGVLLRVDLQEAATIPAWLTQWGHQPGETDLVVDLGDNVSQATGLGPAVAQVFQQIHLGPHWRSITVSGTSMPPNFQGYTQGLHTIQRIEYSLWQQLSAAGLPYHLNYGDYAAAPPGDTPSGISWGFPINVRYTLPHEFLICRGVRTDGPLGVDMSVQLVQHANRIVNHPSRHRIRCWADDKVDGIAAGTSSPQGLEHWVQLGVNRHIELMHAILP